jgi:hypothetical protein
MGIKKRRRLTLISNTLKKLGKVIGKKLKGLELLPTVLQDETTKSVYFYANNFFCRNIFALRNQRQI